MRAWPDRASRRRSLELVRELAVTDFRLKHYDSLLGYSWSLLSPLVMLAIYYFVFRHIVGVRAPDYRIYLLVGVVYWAFFQDCSFSGLVTLGTRAPVLKAIRVAPSLVVAAGVLASVITVAINSAVLVLALAAWGKLSPLFPLVLLPLVCLVLFASGISLLVALAFVRFRDTGLVWNAALQAWFWLTPVVYGVQEGTLAEVLYLNPVARCLYLIRWFLLYDYLPSPRFIAFTAAACVLVFVFAVRLFLRYEPLIPEAL